LYIFQYIHIYVHETVQTKKKRKEEKYKYYIYYHTYNQSGTLGTHQEGRM